MKAIGYHTYGSPVVLRATGKVTPVIDQCYPLREVAEAMRHLGGGHARGKVVITLEDGDES